MLVTTAVAMSIVGVNYWQTYRRWQDINARIKLVELDKPNFENAQIYRDIFAVAGNDLVFRLLKHQNDSVALQSAWRTIVLAVPLDRQNKPILPDSEKLVWFLGFVKDRCNSAIPGWWHEAVLECRASHRHNIFFTEPAECPYKTICCGDQMLGMVELKCPKDDSVTFFGDKFSYIRGNDQVFLNRDILTKIRFVGGEISGVITGSFVENEFFLSVHRGIYVHAFDQLDGSTLLKFSTAFGGD